jgi:hypothetical protein
MGAIHATKKAFLDQRLLSEPILRGDTYMDDAYPSPGHGMPYIAKPGLPTSFAFSRQKGYMS